MNSQDYTLNETQQAIDITAGGYYTSFATVMNVTCENLQDTFEYAIVDRNTLESYKILNRSYFKRTTGTWEDSFTTDLKNRAAQNDT